MKLRTTLGFEITGILKKAKFRNNGDRLTLASDKLNSALSTLVANDLIRWYPRSFNLSRRNYTDGHCCELPSPVFKTTEAAMLFYKRAQRAMNQRGFHPHHADTVCGGNHIHFGLKFPRDSKMVRGIVRDMFNRPYIAWAFTQPDDTDSCDNLASVMDIHNSIKSIRKESPPSIFCQVMDTAFANVLVTDRVIGGDGKDYIHPNHMDNKGYCVGIGSFCREDKKGNDVWSYTFEYRCVEAPLDESELKDQLDFFIAFTEMHRHRTWVPMIDVDLFDNLQKYRHDKAIAEFNQLLIELGLKPSRYEKYVKRNLLPRWKSRRKRT